MKTTLPLVTIPLLLLGLVPPTRGQNETPTSLTGVVYEPCAFHLDARAEVINTLDSTSGQHYSYVKAIEREAKEWPDYTLLDFEYPLQQHHGVFFLATHGDTTGTMGWAAEVYDTRSSTAGSRVLGWSAGET